MSSHEHHTPATDDWQTPPDIIAALPRFDLDPCASDVQRTDTAERKIHWPGNGLIEEWSGTVWLNPPYSKNAIEPWLERMAHHGDGVALIPARVETQWFHRMVWPFASGLFVFRGRLTYLHRDSLSERSRHKGNAMFPSVLVAYGEKCRDWLWQVELEGMFVNLDGRRQRRKEVREKQKTLIES